MFYFEVNCRRFINYIYEYIYLINFRISCSLDIVLGGVELIVNKISVLFLRDLVFLGIYRLIKRIIII